MAVVPSALKKIEIPEVAYRSSVSEATMTKISGSINGIIDQYDLRPATSFHKYVPSVSEITTGYTNFDIDIYFPFNFTVYCVQAHQKIDIIVSNTGLLDFLKNGTTSLLSEELIIPNSPNATVEASLSDKSDYSGDTLIGYANTPTMTATSFSAGEFLRVRMLVRGNGSGGTVYDSNNFTVIGQKEAP